MMAAIMLSDHSMGALSLEQQEVVEAFEIWEELEAEIDVLDFFGEILSV